MLKKLSKRLKNVPNLLYEQNWLMPLDKKVEDLNNSTLLQNQHGARSSGNNFSTRLLEFFTNLLVPDSEKRQKRLLLFRFIFKCF